MLSSLIFYFGLNPPTCLGVLVSEFKDHFPYISQLLLNESKAKAYLEYQSLNVYSD